MARRGDTKAMMVGMPGEWCVEWVGEIDYDCRYEMCSFYTAGEKERI